MLDLVGNIVTWNTGAERIKGYRAEEIIGEHFSKLYPPEDRDRGKPDQELRLAASEGRFEDEGWRVKKDGSLFWANVVITPLYDRKQRIYGYGKLTRDLSERKQMEDQLRQSENLLRLVIDILPVGLWILDKNGQALMGNQAGLKIWGKANYVGPSIYEEHKGWWADTGQEIKQEEWPAFSAIKTGAPILNQRIEIEKFDGTRKIISYSAVPMRDKAGKNLGVVVVNDDITERVQAEYRLKVNEQKFRGLLEAAADAIVIIKPNGKIEFVNSQTEKCFGYSKNELIGQPLEILMPKRFRSAHVCHRNIYSDRPIPRPMGAGLSLFGLRNDGTEFPVDITIAPLKIGPELYMISIVRDISERKTLENERNHAIQVKEDILGMVTHDLKNPLLGISLNSELLSSIAAHKKELSDIRAIAGRIQNLTTQALQLIQDVLTEKKIELGTFSLNEEWVDLDSLVNGAVDMMEPISKRKALRFEKKIPQENIEFSCDRNRILQVLSNLLGNAIKFTPSGGIISLQIQLKPNELIFLVTDTGPGIPSNNIPHLFERYWQECKTAPEGTGLGLSIVKGIVEAHHGKVWAESTVGRGSSFYFTIPRMRGNIPISKEIKVGSK
jgi:PAS domain S-box-containing protein